MLEEQTMQQQEMMVEQRVEKAKYLVAYPDVPYNLLNKVFNKNTANEFKSEFEEIKNYYCIYKFGKDFVAEGSNGDYVPSTLRYKKASMILNKEARFLFANPPTFNINIDNVTGENAEDNAILQDYLDKVFVKTNFHSKLMKAAKDCFVGKRIAIVVNFTEDNKIAIKMLKSTEFVYTFDDSEELNQFVAFYEETKSEHLSEQRWFRKVYTKEKDGVYLLEDIWDGTGEKIETVTAKTKIKLSVIPVAIIFNDGRSDDIRGISELEYIYDYEGYYSKLANSDMDAERKTMHPIRYTIDASEGSTKNLSTSPGSYWDIQTDGEKPNEGSYSAKVGTIEAQMNYSTPLKVTLDRLENEMYAELDVPNITSEQLAGVITSGKTIQALYWGLTVRCDEKMLTWQPGLRFIAEVVIEGSKLYSSVVKTYSEETTLPDIPYDILVENNYPIPEDVKEEKEMDITEIDAIVMSRKAYLKKWRKLNDNEAAAELEQIKLETEMLDNTYLNYSTGDTVSTEDEEAVEEVDDNFKNEKNDVMKVQEGESPNKRNVK